MYTADEGVKNTTKYTQSYEDDGYKGVDCIDMLVLMKPNDTVLWAWLMRNRGANNRVLYSQKDIVTLSGLTQPVVSRSLKNLREMHAITPLTTTGYMLNPYCWFSAKTSIREQYLNQFDLFVSKESE